MTLLLSLACQPALVAEDPNDENAPSAWEYEEPGSSEASEAELPTVEEMASLIDALLPYARTVNGDPIIDIYESSLAGADDRCPGWYDFEGSTYWYGACTSELGTTYDGYGLYYVYVDEDLYGDGSIWNVDYLYGVANITTPTTSFHLGGYVYYGTGEYEGEATVWQSVLAGSFAWEGEATDSWMDDERSPNVSTYFVRYPEWDLTFGVLDGSIGGVEGEITAIDFDNLTIGFHDTLFDSYWPCEGEAMGRVHLRTDAGWIEVAFEDIAINDQGSAYELVGTCDGCGQAYAGGEYLGEVCIDAGNLLDWEEQPW